MQEIGLDSNKKNIRIIVGLVVALVLIFIFIGLRDNTKLITTSEASNLYTQNLIKELKIDDNYLYFITDEGRYKIYKNSINKKTLLQKYKVEAIEDNNYLLNIIYLLIFITAFIIILKNLKNNQTEQLVQIHQEIDRAEDIIKPQKIRAINSNVKFSDVAGIKDVKDELEEIIDFLKEPRKYHQLDIRLPRGILLIGPPGIGKTLVSKAIAGEAGVPFFYQSGASFVHIYVGMGAKRVTELFETAKRIAPSIIFIDEIDAVGKSRGEFRNDEREATLNQLLTEMDGFEDSSGVIVIGATNKVEVLDEALLRSGRFDRRIHISLPDISERLKTLEMYMKKKPHQINLTEVARMTVGFNSAGLSTLVNEAAIYAMRDERRSIELSDFEAVRDKVLLGKRSVVSYSSHERAILSNYQGAKALIATWLDIEFDKIGIVTTQIKLKESAIISKSEMINLVKMYIAGSIVTQKIYKERYTNSQADIREAKRLVKQMITEYGMGDDFIGNASEESRLFKEAKDEVELIYSKLEDSHSKIAKHLIMHEIITEEEARDIIREVF
jgi:ATP-dependent metalloprotease FtsH